MDAFPRIKQEIIHAVSYIFRHYFSAGFSCSSTDLLSKMKLKEINHLMKSFCTTGLSKSFSNTCSPFGIVISFAGTPSFTSAALMNTDCSYGTSTSFVPCSNNVGGIP